MRNRGRRAGNTGLAVEAAGALAEDVGDLVMAFAEQEADVVAGLVERQADPLPRGPGDVVGRPCCKPRAS